MSGYSSLHAKKVLVHAARDYLEHGDQEDLLQLAQQLVADFDAPYMHAAERWGFRETLVTYTLNPDGVTV